MRIIVCIVSSLFFMCNNPVSHSIDDYRSLLISVENEIQKTRGLTFVRPVHYALLTREEYGAYNNKWNNSDNDLFAVELKQLGFIPDTMRDFGEQVDLFNDDFAAAFYVPGTDSVYIIDGDKDNDVVFRYYVSHELIHALQDQNFNAFSHYRIPALSQSLYNSDFYLAQLCLVEGDASLSADLWYLSKTTGISRSEFVNKNVTSRRDTFFLELNKAEIPRYLEIKSLAPYILGKYFVELKQRNNGWGNVNELYHSKRISSTAEIITINPHLMLQSFDFSQITPLLLKNTTSLKFADDDSYGPIMLMGLLNEYVDKIHCQKAFGWQGDRIVYVLKDNNTYGSFVWALQFATIDDAAYIKIAIDKLLSKRVLSGRVASRFESTNQISYSSPMVNTTIFQQDSTIIWMENVPDPSEVLHLVKKSTLARNLHQFTDCSTISKNQKWKLLKKWFYHNNHHGKLPDL